MWLEKFLIFILFLCPLIFFHELGHFLFARLFGVRVETFSIGFGPKLFRFVRNCTEYTISLIPLGGYIKMFGDDPLNEQAISEEDKKYAFNHKSIWARFWIVFGGPFANFIFAYFIFSSLLLVGEKVPLAKFGVVNPNSIFYSKGIKPADILSKLNGVSIQGVTDLNFSENEIIKMVTIRRLDNNTKFNLANSGNNSEGKITDGKEINISLNVPFKTFIEEFFKLSPLRRPILVDVRGNKYVVTANKGIINWNESLEEVISSERNALYLYRITEDTGKGGSKKKNNISSDINDKGVENYQADLGSEKVVNINYNNNHHVTNTTSATATNANEQAREVMVSLANHGFYPLDLQIAKILDDSSARKSGLRSGDLIIALNNEPVYSFEELRDDLQKMASSSSSTNAATNAVTISYYRNTSLHFLKVVPDVSIDKGKKVYKMGVFSAIEPAAPVSVQSEPKGLVESLSLGFARTWSAVETTVSLVKKLISTEVSFKNVGGPFAIGKVASDAYYIGASYFFKIMAVISINLAVLNLLPIPVLDGGHILFLVCEFFNRGPLSRRKMEIAQRFGLSILLLMIFASIFNDITRLLIK